MARPTSGLADGRLRRFIRSWRSVEDEAAAGSLRTRRIRSAVVTSIASKVVTVAFQLLAIPVAVNALGSAQYGAFVIVSSILAWISLGGLGVAPGITSAVAAAFGRGSLDEARQHLSTGLAVSLAAACATAVVVVALVGALATGWGPLRQYLDPAFLPHLPAMTAAMIVVGVAGLLQFPTSVFQAARAGLLEQDISNAWRVVGTLVGLAGMVAVALWAPTMPMFALALAAPAIVAGVGDSVSFVRHHRDLVPATTSVHRGLIRPIVATGGGFLAFSAGGFLMTGVSLVVASGSVPPEDLAPVGILFQLQGLGIGLVTMIAIPLWPSVAHADAASDREWIVRAYRRLRLVALGVGVLGAAGFVVVLPTIARPVFGGSISFAPDLTVPFGLLFLLSCWGTLHAFVLFGLGRAGLVGVLAIVQGVLNLVVLAVALGPLDASAVGIAAVVAAVAVTAWALPVIVGRRLRAGSA